MESISKALKSKSFIIVDITIDTPIEEGSESGGKNSISHASVAKEAYESVDNFSEGKSLFKSR
jgi:hypothetical protein